MSRTPTTRQAAVLRNYTGETPRSPLGKSHAASIEACRVRGWLTRAGEDDWEATDEGKAALLRADNPTPAAPATPPRGELDPITQPLWRLKRPDRVRIMTPFIDRQVKLERWYSRVASGGDRTYTGTLIAIATTTIGSAADLLILKTVDGNVWAISTAQIAYVEHIAPQPRTRGGRRGAPIGEKDPQ